MDKRLQIQLLGSFSAWIDDREVDPLAWKRRKAAAIVKLLALTPGHRLHREQVMDLLWPEHDPEQAANNLYQALHAARRAFLSAGAADVLLLRDQILQLGGDVWVDVVAFEQAAIGARRQGTPEAYGAAIALYTGELLPNDRYEPWTSDRREALQQTYISLLDDLAHLHERSGDYSAGIEVVRRIVTTDPCQESAHRLLMRLYALSGQRQHALRQFQTLREALARELDIEPEPESVRLHQHILAGDLIADRSPVDRPPPPSSARPQPLSTQESARSTIPASGVPPHNLPAPVSRFIGREREKAEVRRILPTTRLLTLTGPGGAGKTRLAYEVAAEELSDYPDGVWIVELAALSEPEFIPQAIGSALGVREVPGQPLIDTLASYLRARQALLVLDNCEHLIDACARFADALLRTCPDIRVLATSREPLRIAGELTWPAPSLSLPDPHHLLQLEQLTRYEAVQLFIDRAAAVSPAFTLTEENAGAIAELCYRLDGMPLAIELAAARTRALSAQGIVERLNDRFRLLTGGSRTALTRQQTLRAALDWSYDLLSEPEQILFARLSVFAGGFDLDAMEAICGGAPIDALDVLDLLTQLVTRSLVVATHAAGRTRYRLLETMREYGRERLAARGETDAIQQRHADFFLRFAKDADRLLRGADHADGLARLEREHDNLRVAMDWYEHLADAGHAEPGMELAGALYWFWQITGYVTEGRNWLDRLLARTEGQRAPGRAIALTAGSWLAISVGEYEVRHGRIDEAVDIFRETGDRDGLATALMWSSFMTLFRGRIDEARIKADESMALFKQTGNPWGRALALHSQGFVASEAGEYEQAGRSFEESLAIFRELNDRWGIATTQAVLGHLMYRRGDLEQAREYVAGFVAIARETGDRWLLVQSLTLLGEIARAQADYATTRAACEESLRLSREINHMALVAWTLRDLGYADCADGHPADARERFNESLAIFRQQDYALGVVCCLAGFAAIAEAEAQRLAAATLLGAVQSALESLNLSLAPADRAEFARTMTALRTTLGEGAFQTHMHEGRRLSLGEAIVLATRPS